MKINPFIQPHGIQIINNFISVDDETRLVSIVKCRIKTENVLMKRAVVHFGKHFDYKNYT